MQLHVNHLYALAQFLIIDSQKQFNKQQNENN